MKYFTIFAMIWVASVASADPTTKPSPATRPAKPPIPAADQLMNSMLKPPTDTGRVLTSLPNENKIDAGTGRAIAPNAPPVRLRREGSTLPDALGRLTKAPDGQWEFALEADAKTMQDPPLIILPNQNLAAMESAISGASRDLKFRVTGVVTEYKGRNYILLEKVVVPPDATEQF